MRYFILYSYLFSFLVSKSQNLVPNPSFEFYSSCPSNTGQINNATPWIATISTPDYFNACSTSTTVLVPKNFFCGNYQLPKTDNAYSGLHTLGGFGNNIRENMGVQLTSTLINNNYYLTKFYIANMQCYKVANNNIALNFSSNLTYTVVAGGTVNLPMHIYKFGNPVIKDTLNWTEIMGIYKANGTEQYITIGNFKDDNNTKIDTVNIGALAYAGYYMIDDVSVESICAPFWSYRDTTVTLGDSVLIGPAITGLNVNWYDSNNNFITNAPGVYVKPNSPTFYTASEDFCGSIITHTINVMVTPTWVKEYDELVNSFLVYPNPVKDKIIISSTMYKTEELKVIFTDVLGREIFFEKVLSSGESQILNLANLDKGIYFVTIYSQAQLIVTKKIIKE